MVMSLLVMLSGIHKALPWTLKGKSMLQPMVLTPSKPSYHFRSYEDVESPTGIVIDEEGYSLVNE